MSALGPASFLKVVLVLLFGGGSDSPVSPSDPQPVPRYIANAPVYAELNLAEARSFIADSPHVQQLLFGGPNTDPTAFRRRAVAQMADMLKLSDTTLLQAVNQVQRIHFAVLRFADDDDAFRFGLLLDCGSARAVLADTFAVPPGGDSPFTTSVYGKTPIYQIGRADEGVWLAEREGRIMLALDPILVQRFVTGADQDARNRSASDNPVAAPTMLRLEINPNAITNDLLASIKHDRDEFFMIGALLDIGSWKKLTASYDGKELVADLTFAEGGSYAGRFAGSASPPSVLKWIPETSFLSVAVSLEQPKALGMALFAAFQRGFAWAGEHGQMQKFLEETRQGLGLDLETEVLPNMSEMALVFAQPEDEPIAFLYKAKNETAARQLVSKLRAAHAPEGGQMTRQGAWETMDMDDAMVGRNGSTIIVGPQNNRQLEAMLRPGDTPKTALARFREQFPESTATLCFSPWNAAMSADMPPMDPIRVGLNAEKNRLQLRAQLDIATLAKPLMRFLGFGQD